MDRELGTAYNLVKFEKHILVLLSFTFYKIIIRITMLQRLLFYPKSHFFLSGGGGVGKVVR